MPDLDENLIKRIMPHDDETERALLGAFLMDQERIPAASEYVTEQDFYNRQYAAAYTAIVELYNSGQPVDPVTLHNKLSEMDVPPEATTMEFISSLINADSVSSSAVSYARSISDKATLRRLRTSWMIPKRGYST